MRFSSVLISRTLFALNFLKEFRLMVTGMEGGGGNFFLSKKIIYMTLIDICHFRHQVWRLIIEICICINRW